MKSLRLLLILFFTVPMLSTYAQKPNLVYTNTKSFPVWGKVADTRPLYHRIDTAAFSKIPGTVKNLLTNPAGLFLHFKTNSPVIAAKWCVSEKKAGNNMTPIMAKGLDLYIKNEETGQWQFAGVGRPSDTCSTYTLVANMDDTEKECLLYLPLFDTLHDLEIGVAESASLIAADNPFQRNVLIYGSSIVHGASASRPGMAYPARLSRYTGINFINLGVSGNAKMEAAVADMLATFTADAFVLDCVPNSSPQQIKERTGYLVKTIRQAHPGIPIIMVATIVREHGFWNQEVGKHVAQQNQQIEAEYNKLTEAGVDDLYFVNPPYFLGQDHEGTTDGTHPNDIGFSRMIEHLQPAIMAILRKYPAFK